MIDKMKEMIRSRLIQRIRKPVDNENPFSFGGGLKRGGMNKEAFDAAYQEHQNKNGEIIKTNGNILVKDRFSELNQTLANNWASLCRYLELEGTEEYSDVKNRLVEIQHHLISPSSFWAALALCRASKYSSKIASYSA